VITFALVVCAVISVAAYEGIANAAMMLVYLVIGLPLIALALEG
jgi:hypothetical protein